MSEMDTYRVVVVGTSGHKVATVGEAEAENPMKALLVLASGEPDSSDDPHHRRYHRRGPIKVRYPYSLGVDRRDGGEWTRVETLEMKDGYPGVAFRGAEAHYV